MSVPILQVRFFAHHLVQLFACCSSCWMSNGVSNYLAVMTWHLTVMAWRKSINKGCMMILSNWPLRPTRKAACTVLKSIGTFCEQYSDDCPLYFNYKNMNVCSTTTDRLSLWWSVLLLFTVIAGLSTSTGRISQKGPLKSTQSWRSFWQRNSARLRTSEGQRRSWRKRIEKRTGFVTSVTIEKMEDQEIRCSLY